ncbi:hypothetical protein ABW19_dt0205633 [Dactylella cylindrospora]|nr:hypothetical protein ABW19_dt0205633 [Dactylella cylindrospora]
MSFINKSNKKIAPKKPQHRGGSILHASTPSSAEHTASPAPSALASTHHPQETRASSAQPSIGIATKPLATRETPTRDDSSHILPTDNPARPTSPTIARTTPQRDASHPPSPQLQRAKLPARRGAGGGGIPISMPGAARPVTRTQSPEVHRIQPARRERSRDPSEEARSKRPRLSTEREIPSPASTPQNAPVAPSPSRISSATPQPQTQSSVEPHGNDGLVPDAPDTPSGAGEATTSQSKPTPKPRKRRKKNDTGEPNGEASGNGDGQTEGDDQEPKEKKKRGRKPKSTPHNAENLEIEPTVVRMTDLCRDTFIGKKSKLYEEIEKIDWLDVVKKQRARKAEIEARRAAGEDVQLETVEQRLDRLARENAAARGGGAGGMAPQMRIVNGQLVLDETSVQVDRRERDVGADGPLEIIEESNLTRRVNSATWSKREKTERWDDEETERFYDALSMFGTDFEMMSKMFIGRSRRMLKNKFVVEERRNPKVITAALKKKIPVNMEEYSRLAARQFGEVEEVEGELRRIREEHEKGIETAAAESSALAKERNEAAMAELAKQLNGEGDGHEGGKDGEKHPHKRQRKGKKKFVSRQGGDDEAVVLGTVDEWRKMH